MTSKEPRLNLPIGHLRTVLTNELGAERVKRLKNTYEVEALASRYFPKAVLEEKVAELQRGQRKIEMTLTGNGNRGSARLHMDGPSDALFFPNLTSTADSASEFRRLSNESYSQCEHGGQSPYNEKSVMSFGDRGSLSSNVVTTKRRSIPSENRYSMYSNDSRVDRSGGGGRLSYGGGDDITFSKRSCTAESSPYAFTDLYQTRRPTTANCCSSQMNRSSIGSPRAFEEGGSSTAGYKATSAQRWTAETPLKESSGAETPLLITRTKRSGNYGPSHFSNRYGGDRSQNYCFDRINEDEAYNSPDMNPSTLSRFKTPFITTISRICNAGRSRPSVESTPFAGRQSSCRPFDQVPYNPNPQPFMGPGPSSRRSMATPTPTPSPPSTTTRGSAKAHWMWTLAKWCYHHKVVIAVAVALVWLFGLPKPSSLTGIASLLPTTKATGTLPKFCSSKRQPGQTCTACPWRALCIDGKAECPTYYALEKGLSSEWVCVSYKAELEKIAEEGFNRVVAHLRRIEKPVACEDGRPHSDAQRDVLFLFDSILLPLLDERQKGLKDGLLQMYLTLLTDDTRLKTARLEKEGSLHVSLGSVASRERVVCYMPGRSWTLVVGVLGVVALLVSALR